MWEEKTGEKASDATQLDLMGWTIEKMDNSVSHIPNCQLSFET